MANSKYVPNRNVIQDKRKKKEEEEKKTGYRYDSKGRKITSSNTSSGEKKTTSSGKSGEVKKTSPSSANRTSGTQMRINRAEAAKAGMNGSKPETKTAAPYASTSKSPRDKAIDYLYKKYNPSDQQIMQGVGNNPNKDYGTKAYHEKTWKGATEFQYDQIARGSNPTQNAQYNYFDDLVKASGGNKYVLDTKQKEIENLKKQGETDDWWLGWTGLKKQTNKKKINEAEDQYQDYKNALRKFGFDSVSAALNSEDPNAAAAKGIIDKQYKYTSDNMADDLVTIDEALRYGTNKGSEFDAAVERLNAYYGEDVLPRIEEIHDPAGMWMNEFLDRYDADRAELDTFVKDSSGVSGTDAEITADDMFAYREAVDNQVENETKLAEWNVSRDAMHESFRADPEYDTFAQYIPRGEWYTSAVDSDNGIEKWDDASMLNDLVNAVHTGEYDKIAEEIMGTQHSDTAAALIDYIRYMSPDDVSDFNYILNTSGYDEAFKFITEDIMWNLGRQYEDEKATRIQQDIAENPWMAVPYSITSFGDMLASGIGGVAAAINPLTGQELNEYHPLLSWSRGMNTKRGATTGMLMNEFEDASIAGFHVPSILYNGAMSAVDSAINTAIYNHMATPMMAFSAYGSSLYQNLESMGNGAGAYIDAAIDGGIEALTEYFSVEGLLDDAVSSGLKTFSKQLITEPSEEVFGELLRFGYDAARNGENSEVNRQINDLIAQGYSESEAEAIAARDFARKLGETIFTSAISGAAGGARNAIQQGTANYQAGKQFREFGDTEDYTGLIDIAKTVDLNKNEKKLLERLEAEIAAGGAQEAETEEDVPETTAEQEATEQQEAPKPEINPAERLNDMQPQEREKKEAPPLPVFDRNRQREKQNDIGTEDKQTETAPEETAEQKATEQQEAPEPEINPAERLNEMKPQERKAPPEAVEEQAEDIAEEVKENPKANAAKAADKMNKAAKAKGAKKVTKAQLGMLYRSVAAKLDERAQDALRERMSFNVAKELQQKGVKGEKAKELATSILRIQDGNFTQEDYEAVQNDSVARSVLADWTQKLDAENKAQAQMAQIRSIMTRSPMTVTGGAKDGEKDAIEANDEFAVKAAEVEEKAKGKLISDDEDSTIDGEAVKIVGAAPAETADGGNVAMVKVQTADGTERIVAADSIAYSEADSAAYDLAQYATSYGANADIMYGAYQAGQDVGAYAAAFDIAARHGSDGRNINTLLGGSVANVLTENQIKTAYELGRGMRAQRSQKAQAARSKKGAGAKVGNVDTSAIADEQLNKHQRATVKAMEGVAELLGINVRFVESKADAKGRFTTENGSWDANTRTLTVDIHAGSNLKNDVHYSMMDTVGHELTHYIRQLADSKMWDDYQNFVMSHLGEKMDLGKEIEKKLAQNEGLSRDDAIEEIIADASAQALSRITDQQIAEMAQSNPNLLKKIAAFIKKWVSDFRKQIRKAFSTQEAAANRFAKAMEDSLDEMAAKWNAMLVNAQKNAQGTKADTTVEAAMAEATEGAVNEDGEKLFSLRTMREDKDYYRELLIEYGSMNHADIRALFNTIDKLMAEIEENRTILDFGEDIDSDKRSFKPLKPNSDPLYQVSVDFSTLCRKRLLQQVCQERLEAAMGRAVTKAERVAIRDELIKLQKQGKQIEVACALCYVESARLKSPAQIQRFMENREKVIRDYFARRNPETKAKMEKAEADYRKANNIGNESLKNLPSAIAKKVRNAKNAPIAEYKVSAQEQKTIDKAMGMTVSEFTTADSLWNLKSSDPVLFDIYTSYIRNATKSKGIESDTPWKAGDSEAISDTLIEKMNQENGLRTQSWSDFQTYHILDYIASVIELSTRNAKMQAYTKVPAYVKLMGKTGIMINMSLIPAAKFDGSLQYDDVEGFVHETAFDLRKKYPETAGTICIGIDDTQIEMLLENDEIDYVIPYHKSGMDAKTRQKMQIPTWKDYELQQSEKPLNKKAGKAPKFSEWFDYKTAVSDAEYANSTAEGKAAIAAGDVMYGAKIAMQNAAQHYMNLCAERNLAPKFEKFKNEDGYWKLLIDRKMINNETGAIIEQKAVQPRFNEDDLIEICRDEVARYKQNNADFDAAVDAILKAYEDGTLGKTAKSKKVQQIVKSHEDWVAVQAAIGTHDQLVPDVKLSAREMDTEYQKAYESGDEYRARELVRKAAIAAGYNPLKLYHGTGKFGFTSVDTSMSDDGISFFTTTSERVAETYSGESKTRRIGDKSDITSDDLLSADANTLLNLLHKHVDDRYEIVSEEEKSKLIAEENHTLGLALNKAYAFEKDNLETFKANIDARQAIANITHALTKMVTAQKEGDVIRAMLAYEDAFVDLRFADGDLSWELADAINADVNAAKGRKIQYLHGFMFKISHQLYDEYAHYDNVINELYPKLFRGIYELYGRTENMLEVDAEARNWNQLDGETIGRYGFVRTRDYAEYAKTHGYNGVHFKNIRDNGGQTAYSGASDVYTFFNPSDIKSADPFTFDDDGNLIPLSERFNKKETDMRYSAREENVSYQMRDPSEVSDREMLVSMLDNVNLSVEDRNRLNVYRERIGELNEKQQLLEQTTTKISMLRKADEKGNREEIIKLKNQAEVYAKQIERADAKLMEIEALKPIKEMAKRQRAAYVEEARKASNERIRKYRDKKDYDTAVRIAEIREKEAEKRKTMRKEMDRLKNAAEPNLKERYRNKIISDVKKLYSWVATPTNKAHVPEFLKAPLGEFIQSIDFSSADYLKNAKPGIKDISMAEALEKLRRVLANVHNQKSIEEGAEEQFGYMDLPAQYLEQLDVFVGNVKEALQNAATVTDTPLMLLNSDQLKYLSETIAILKHSVEKMNENFNNNQFNSPRSAANATIEDMYKLKAKIKTNQMLETLNGMYNWKNATPIYAFQRLGAGGRAVFAGMQDGWDKMAQNSATLIEFAENTFTAKQAKEWSRDIKTIELANGESVKLTVAQIMSIYCLNKREQAVGHLLGGGMRVAEIKLGKGNVLNQAENHTLTEGDIGKMISQLTTEQISVATKLQTFMNTVCSDWGNEISMKRFGYKMFTEQFYFPIEVDPNNLIGGEDKQEKKNSMFRLLNMSAMKPLTPKANNALIVRDIFDVFTAHSTDIAKYNALALPILDMIRWYNYVEKSDVLDKEGRPTGQIRTRSTQRALEHAYGSNAKQYIRRFMEDLNAEHDGGRNDGVLQKLMGNAKAASVGANARVYFLQITSLPRAAYVINPKYLMKGLMKLRSLNPVNAIKGTEAQDKIGIMKWKSLGFYNTDIARSTRGMVRRDEGFLSKLRGWVMKPAEWGDNWVGNIIYEAAKAEMKDKHPGAKPGTKAYDELLNRRVREIVYKTQVVDSTMTRSDFMRSKGIMQLFTAFMSEPTLTVNMLNESVQEAVANRRSGMTGKENWKSVGGKAARALATFAVSACSAALIEALFDAFRDDDEYETFWEKYLDGLFGERMKDADTFGKKFWAFFDGNIAENMNVISMLPLFKDALSKLQGFEENSMVMQVVDQFMDTWKAIDAWQKGERPLYNAIYNMLKVVGSSSGVGVQNATRDGIAIWNTFFADAVGQPKVQTYENTKSDAAAAYYDAIRNDDTEKAEWILERAAIRGLDAEDFTEKIKNHVKADYIEGEIDAAEATKYLTEIAGKTKDDAYWMLKEWDYAGEGNFSKYGDLRTALIDGNKSNAQAAYNELITHGSSEQGIRNEISKMYNNGTATNMLSLQLRSNNLYTSGVKLKADGEIHKDDFDAFITAIVNGSGIEREADKLFEKGYTVKQCMGAINGAFGNSSDIYRKMEMYNSREAAILMDRILDGYEAIGLDRQDEIEWIEDNWKM